jgi:serine/threonine protein kinase
MNQAFTSFQEFKRRYPIRPNDAGALLGNGSYGRVIKVEDQLETEWVAIKISEFKGQDAKSLRAEVELAQRVPRQANIARYDACHRLETDTSISDFAIMKYYPDGNLADLLRRETLTRTQIYDITKGILLGLQHLHRHRIVHRDFKPANILISRDNAGRFIPKIADFGLSKLVSDDELDSSDFDLSDGRGTPSYKAPEQIEGSRVSFNLDLWAFGVILYEILTGEKPFRSDLKNSSEQSVRREIEKKIITVELPTRLNQIAEPYASIIRRCLVRDIHDRARKEDELLDLLDQIPQLMAQANTLLTNQKYTEALSFFEQVIAKREHHVEAQEGASQCRTVLERQHIRSLLTEADNLLKQQQFERAKHNYEQLLQLYPSHAEAARGLVVCIEQLRPKPIIAESELTDAYQVERTDVYMAPPVPVVVENVSKRGVISESVIAKPSLIEPNRPNKPLAKLTKQPSGVSLHGRVFPWRIIAPTAVVIGGLVWYFTTQTSEPTRTSGQTATKQRAAIISPSNPNTGASELEIKPVLNETKDALAKRIDIAFHRARQAYKQQDYATALVLTNSALQLDPTRQDVAKLRDAALIQSQSQASTDKQSEPVSTTVAELANPVGPPMTAEAKADESVDKASSISPKQEAQETYDQLIEEGYKAMTTNNKTKAITTFSKAQAMAKEQDLSTVKSDAAYTYSLTKGKNYFDRDEFEGAKAWFEVAQSLKNTDEVRRKIKQCSN